ncbi:MAG: Maf family protein [Deltaproteobacteria bacterium]|nr:Maf family protein [Deltaproteobacteria bacterium]
MSARLVLASTSRYRRLLLDRLGVAYAAVPHDVDERAFEQRWRNAGGGSAEDLALSLAHAKADSVRTLEPSAWIIGSDQACDLAGELLHKPGTAEGACAQLSRSPGRRTASSRRSCSTVRTDRSASTSRP